MSEQHLHQIIEQIPKQKPDLHRRKVLANYHQRHHSRQVKHLINQQMIILSRNTHLKENKVGHQMFKKIIRKTKPKPDHDTEKDGNQTRTHWRKAKRVYLVDQLSKHGWRWPTKKQMDKYKAFTPRIGPNYDRSIWSVID